MTAATLNLEIEKKAKFYKEMQITLSDGSGKSLEGKVIYCNIKESTATDTYLFQLTEANGGIIVLDDSEGRFALSIDADETDISADFGVYNVWEETEAEPETEDERVLQGKIVFSKGI